MGKRFPEYKGLDLSKINKEILKVWDENDTFHKSIREVNDKGEFVFYEGPRLQMEFRGSIMLWPALLKTLSVVSRHSRDYEVKRKAGWDTPWSPCGASG